MHSSAGPNGSDKIGGSYIPATEIEESVMVAAARVHKVGGPEVLTYEEVEVPAPGAGQIRIRQHACGLNFI
ncbi:MAG: hypothetical protein ACXWU5_05845, partial [Rhodoplanes sp.]